INFRFNNVSIRDILTTIANASGFSVSFDREFQDRQATVQLDGVTLEQALNQIMTMNGLSYKVLSERSIFVFQDTPPKHAQYDEPRAAIVVDVEILEVDRSRTNQSGLSLTQYAVGGLFSPEVSPSGTTTTTPGTGTGTGTGTTTTTSTAGGTSTAPGALVSP